MKPYPTRIIINDVNIYDLIDVTNFELVANVDDVTRIKIEGYPKCYVQLGDKAESSSSSSASSGLLSANQIRDIEKENRK